MIDGYDGYDATALAELVSAGDVSPEELLDAALAETERWNPKLTAVVFQDADLARRKIADGLPEGPLRGVPFLIKDSGAETPDFPVSIGSSRCHVGISFCCSRLRNRRTFFSRFSSMPVMFISTSVCAQRAVE